MEKFKRKVKGKTILALGADMTNSVCLAADKFYLSEPVGDLEDVDNFMEFKKHIEEMLNKAKPDMIVCDMHPSYTSSEYAQILADELKVKLVKVQHQKAHAAAAAYEHGLDDYTAIVCDGLGYGDDGKLWGGEVFNVTGTEFKRVGSLQEQKQLGGDAAAQEPKRMLFGILHSFMDDLTGLFESPKIKLYNQMMDEEFNVFETTSTARVLDASAALLGVQNAIALDAFASKPYDTVPVIEQKERKILNTTTMFRYLVNNLHKEKKRLAATVQMYIAKGMHRIAQGDKPIVFTGGVAQNKMISQYMKKNKILLNKKIPCSDAGLAIGQAILAEKA